MQCKASFDVPRCYTSVLVRPPFRQLEGFYSRCQTSKKTLVEKRGFLAQSDTALFFTNSPAAEMLLLRYGGPGYLESREVPSAANRASSFVNEQSSSLTTSGLRGLYQPLGAFKWPKSGSHGWACCLELGKPRSPTDQPLRDPQP